MTWAMALLAPFVAAALVEVVLTVRDLALRALHRRRARRLRIEPPGPYSASERVDGRWL